MEGHSGRNMGLASRTGWAEDLEEARIGSEAGQKGARSLPRQRMGNRSRMGAVQEEAHIHWGCASQAWRAVVQAEEDTRLPGQGDGGGG